MTPKKTEDLIGYSDIGLLLIKKMNPTIFRHASLRPYECLGGFGRDVRQWDCCDSLGRSYKHYDSKSSNFYQSCSNEVEFIIINGILLIWLVFRLSLRCVLHS